MDTGTALPRTRIVRRSRAMIGMKIGGAGSVPTRWLRGLALPQEGHAEENEQHQADTCRQPTRCSRSDRDRGQAGPRSLCAATVLPSEPSQDIVGKALIQIKRGAGTAMRQEAR